MTKWTSNSFLRVKSKQMVAGVKGVPSDAEGSPKDTSHHYLSCSFHQLLYTQKWLCDSELCIDMWSISFYPSI